MPSTYSKIVGPSGRKKYDADRPNMMKAIDSVNRKGLSIREAARKHKAPRSTLSDKVKARHPKPLGGQTLISEEEEIVLAHITAVMADWGYPLTFMDIRMLLGK